MNTSHNPIIRVWQWWFTPHSTDPIITYRERALRVLLPVFVVLRVVALANAYSDTNTAPSRYLPLGVTLVFLIVPFSLSFYFLINHRVGWSGSFFLLNWYLMDMFNLPVDGYWHPGFQISLILQIVLATLLLPGRAIIPFWAVQVVTVGIWGNWLDMNYYDPPLLSSGQPVAVFLRTIITLAIQEAIIMFVVRYLRLEMEKSLRLQKANIKELNARNAELERFTYTVSHDLKSPLVTIKGFLGRLKKDIEENRQDRVEKDFERIAEAADKMGILLSELLELSRIGRIVNPPEEVDLCKLTQVVLETLDGRLREHKVTVTVLPDLPIVYADCSRLREVLENLIDNASKYMGDQASPHIEIGKRESGTEIIVYVKDNGIGIEPQFHTKIFGLFEKLSAYGEGTGIGLALVKRILETHNGRIWVESDGLGKGSTFCFTIPDGRKAEWRSSQ